MNAVEFRATVNNGVITLPSNTAAWNGKNIKVILLDETDAADLVVSNEEPQASFFAAAGIWRDREVSQESIRAAAWRDAR